MADDIAALIRQLGSDRANVMGYSLGGGVALRTAIQHPQVVNRLILVSTPFKQTGWYPEIVASMAQMDRSAVVAMKESPMYQSYVRVAPQPENFPVPADKTGDLLRQQYDWSDEVEALSMPVLIVYGDADSIPPMHAVHFFELLGGGKRDAGWDGAGMPDCQLAIPPGTTHYNIFSSPALVTAVLPFLNATQQAVTE